VAELCAAGIGALYIPLPWAAEDHQTANARAVARVGGAVVLAQGTTTAVGLARVLLRLLDDHGAVARLGAGALRLARPDAASRVADLVEQVEAVRLRLPAASARRAARNLFQRSLALRTPPAGPRIPA
jgi:UDP-N-acetylglucosamine--N-acetylmuramyl-(pentapeptide) pyrophosphoryl-undecaprenol N-acetylglucosamine transferase